ncbi:MAG: helix-turn-helix transcriptional regulator [Gemmatimonadetes bacterium]|nr:helix-turn-helix transcriptional regulator [Gemmatimonadota bacterium]
MFTPELKKGSVELLVLALLAEAPRHGYQIGKLIEARSRGLLTFRVSSLYPVLARMEERGWVRGRWVEKGEQRLRFYHLTSPGKAALARKQETWRTYARVIDELTGWSHA